MKNHLWQINEQNLDKTNLYHYSNFIKNNYKFNSQNDFNKIWKWSVENPGIFWKSIWEFTKVKGNLGKTTLKESDIFLKTNSFLMQN
jgi:acetoacetyl-CoA synthetase